MKNSYRAWSFAFGFAILACVFLGRAIATDWFPPLHVRMVIGFTLLTLAVIFLMCGQPKTVPFRKESGMENAVCGIMWGSAFLGVMAVAAGIVGTDSMLRYKTVAFGGICGAIWMMGYIMYPASTEQPAKPKKAERPVAESLAIGWQLHMEDAFPQKGPVFQVVEDTFKTPDRIWPPKPSRQ